MQLEIACTGVVGKVPVLIKIDRLVNVAGYSRASAALLSKERGNCPTDRLVTSLFCT